VQELGSAIAIASIDSIWSVKLADFSDALQVGGMWHSSKGLEHRGWGQGSGCCGIGQGLGRQPWAPCGELGSANASASIDSIRSVKLADFSDALQVGGVWQSARVPAGGWFVSCQ
jgi:hypothetical protein